MKDGCAESVGRSLKDVPMSVEPLRAVRDHLSEFVDRAEREHERVVVARNGRPAAVLIGYEDLAALLPLPVTSSPPRGSL